MQEKNPPKNIPVRFIKGVGPQRAVVLNKAGIHTVEDLFNYLPRRYEDRSRIVQVKDIVAGEYNTVTGKVLKKNVFTAKTGTRIFEIAVGDGSNRVFAVWYNQPYMQKVFQPGQKVVLYGKCEVQRRLQIVHPAYEILEADEVKKDSLDIGRIVPVYPLSGDLTQKYLRKIIYGAIHGHLSSIVESLPARVITRGKLVDLRFAVENIHFPYSMDNLERAYRRFVFEEFFTLQVAMALKRRAFKSDGIKHEVEAGRFESFSRALPFELTDSQKKCVKEIEGDMSSGTPMYRLLQGDVGSGKTVVAMYAAYLSVTGGHQAAVMAPTEILARQHYVSMSQIFMPMGINVRLLVSGMDDKDREKVEKEIVNGDADLVVGTHSLIQEGVEFRDLALAVVDEQHKFGVMQRKSLRKKGRTPDMLFMTATPIPRSLVLSLFGDMDVSTLKEKPAGRQDVATYWVEEERRGKVYEFIREEVSSGRQAYIVYPRIKASEKEDKRSAEKMFGELSRGPLSGLRLAMVHGRMASGDKETVMREFKSGKFDVLVATTVIEVGIDVPNATVMLIENAENYGLAQLHQLRGRIGRGKHDSFCILMGDTRTDASEERIRAMTSTDDGFSIAEKDLDIRGPGEFFGTRQSGLPELRFGDISRDFSIMEEARREAFEAVSEDPALADPRNAIIKENVMLRFSSVFKGPGAQERMN